MIITEKDCGIYKITNLQNGKLYVGQSARGLLGRFRTHKHLLIKNRHRNKHLQSAWNKYGEDAFKFEVIELIDEKENNDYFCMREQYYIDYYLNEGAELYNIAPVAGTNRGIKRTDEQKEKTREAAKNQWLCDGYREEVYGNCKDWPPFQDEQGNIYNIKNLSRFCKDNNIDKSCMFKLMKGEISSAYGFKLLSFVPKYSYTLIDLDGNIYPDIQNLNKFAKTHSLDLGTLSKLVTGEYRRCGKFMLYGEKPKYSFISPNNEVIHTNNLLAFCREYDLSEYAMRNLITRRQKQHKGWTIFE